MAEERRGYAKIAAQRSRRNLLDAAHHLDAAGAAGAHRAAMTAIAAIDDLTAEIVASETRLAGSELEHQRRERATALERARYRDERGITEPGL